MIICLVYRFSQTYDQENFIPGIRMATNYIKKVNLSHGSRPGAKAGRALVYSVSTLIVFAIAALIPTAMIFVDVPVDLIDHTLYGAIGFGGHAAIIFLARKRKLPKFMKKFMEKAVQISAILLVLAVACLGLYISKYSVPFMAWYTFG